MLKQMPAATVWMGGHEIHIAPMATSDADEVARLNRSVEIRDTNYRYRLTPDDPDALNTIGGMFVVNNKAQLTRIANDPDELMAVARLSTGELLAAFWFSKLDPHFAEPSDGGLRLRLLEPYAALADELRPSNPKLVYARELIASRRSGVHNLTLVMLLYCQTLMERQGYEKTLYEVYRVLSYRDSLGEYDVDMLNERSYAAMTHNGGTPIGTHEPFELEKKDDFGKRIFSAVIEPQVMLWDVRESVRMLESKLAAMNAKIVWQDA